MRRALGNLNSDLVQQHPDYVCRVTADEGSIGRGHMEHFQDVDRPTPGNSHHLPAPDYRAGCADVQEYRASTNGKLDDRVQADNWSRNAGAR